jgi:hypothetical protein
MAAFFIPVMQVYVSAVAVYFFRGPALRAAPEMGDYGGSAPVIPHFSVCGAYANPKVICCLYPRIYKKKLIVEIVIENIFMVIKSFS